MESNARFCLDAVRREAEKEQSNLRRSIRSTDGDGILCKAVSRIGLGPADCRDRTREDCDWHPPLFHVVGPDRLYSLAEAPRDFEPWRSDLACKLGLLGLSLSLPITILRVVQRCLPLAAASG